MDGKDTHVSHACLVVAFNIDQNELGVNLHCNGMITSRYCCQVNNHIITETDRQTLDCIMYYN